MSNANIGAFPSLAGDAWNQPYMAGGLTKRELFAAMAMQGLSTNYRALSPSFITAEAVKLADALLAALEEMK